MTEPLTDEELRFLRDHTLRNTMPTSQGKRFLATLDAREQQWEWLVGEKTRVLFEVASSLAEWERKHSRWDTQDASPTVTKLSDAAVLTVADFPGGE